MISVASRPLGSYANYEIGYEVLNQSVADNTSTVRFYGVLNVTGYNISWDSGNASVWGATWGLGTSYNTGSHIVVQQDVTLYHDTNGNYSNTLSGAISTSYLSTSVSGSFTLPRISRTAVMLSATDFTDEENPTITFNNPAGYRINAGIEYGGQRFITKENIANTGTYTFELTTAQRNTLRQACTGKTMTIRFVIATCIGGTSETNWDWVDRTLTIANANPTFNCGYGDINPTTLAITLNNQQIIRNQSALQIQVSNTDAKKYATLSTLTAVINGVTYTGDLRGTGGEIDVGSVNLSSNTTAQVILTDSRGYSTTQTLNLIILDWQLPTAIIELARQNNFYSETDINVDANYSSLDSKNTITLKVRTKKTTDQSYGSYTTLQDNVTTTLTLDNLYEWDVQVLVEDKLGSTTYNLSVGIGIPIIYFDRLKRSVGINCFPQNNTSLEVSGVDIINKLNAPAYNIVTDGNEVKVGYQVDGNDVYAKRFHFSSIASGTEVSHGLTNFKIIKREVVEINDDLYHFPDLSNATAYLSIDVTSTKIRVFQTLGVTGTMDVTLFYIKTS